MTGALISELRTRAERLRGDDGRRPRLLGARGVHPETAARSWVYIGPYGSLPQFFRTTKFFSGADGAWGPKPGERGCQAPAEIVEKYGIATHA